LQNRFVRLSGNLFDNCTEKKITRIVVSKFRSGLEFEIAARKFFDKVRDGIRIAAHIGEKVGKARIARYPGSMIKELMDRDFVSRIFSIIGQIIRELSVELDLSFLDKLQDERRGKLLGDGTDAKFCVRLIRDHPFHIRHPKAFLVNYLALFSNQNRAVKLPVVVILLQQ